MKLQHFQDVVTIAERGSIRAAARHLKVAQPALTRSLSDLERELGAPLFERRARGVVATPLGRAFLRRAALILQEVRRTREEVAQLRDLGGGTVTVGLSIAAHLALLPSALNSFRTRYPGVRLHIIEGFYPTLQDGLRDGTVDFYIGPEAGSKPLPELRQEVLFANRRTILCRKSHPLRGARSLSDLVDADWVTTSITTAAEDEIGILFAEHGLPAPRLAVRSQSAMTLMTCLSHADLLAMVPVQWCEFELTRSVLTTIPVEEPLAAPPLVIVSRADLPLTPAAEHFLDLLRRAKSRMPAPPRRRGADPRGRPSP
jgi:LysR family transcriptional regulator, regulator of abg operon